MKIFKFETKRLLNIKTILVITVFLIFLILIIFQCINQYSDQVDQCKEFQQLERVKTTNSIDLIRSGFRGFLIFNSLAKQTPVSVLFQGSALYDNLYNTIDNSGKILENFSKSGKNVPEKQSGLFSDLSRYVLYVLGFLCALFGFFAFWDKSHIKFLFNFGGKMSVYTGLYFSRVLYIIITILLLAAVLFLVFLSNGIHLSSNLVSCVLIYSGVSIFLMSLFLLTGFFAGLARSIFKGAMVIPIFWMLIIFIIPGVLNILFINPLISDMKSIYKNEAHKFKIIRDFDEMVKNKLIESKKEDRKQLYKEINEQFLEEEYEKIKDLEKEMIRETEAVIKKICFINMFSPVTFYESVTGEMTVGLQALLDFHKFSFEKQQKIVEFYIKSYFDRSIEVGDIPVVYQLKSRLPYYFLAGLLLNLFWVILAFAVFYACFSRALFPRIKKDFKDVKIKAGKGDYLFLNLRNGGRDFSNKIFNTFFKKGESFDGEININDKNISGVKVFYLPDLKDVKMNDLRILSGGDTKGIESKTFAELTFRDLVKLFPGLKQSDVLILDNLNFDHCIEPDKDIIILEMNTQSVYRKYNHLYLIYVDKDSYKVKMKRKENPVS